MIWMIIAAVLVVAASAQAQQNHAQRHAFYQGWVNKHDKGCCNNQHCGEITVDDESTKDGCAGDQGRERVTRHFIRLQHTCARLVCYQPKPGT